MFSTIVKQYGGEVKEVQQVGIITTYEELKDMGLVTTSPYPKRIDTISNITSHNYIYDIFPQILNVVHDIKKEYSHFGFLNTRNCDNDLFKIIVKNTKVNVSEIYDGDDEDDNDTNEDFT